MAKSIWEAADRKALLERLERLEAGDRPRWGQFTVGRMLRHCELGVLAAMGEYAVAPKPTPFKNWLMQRLILYVLPWPKGAPTAPELLPAEDGDFRTRVAGLRAAIEKFVSRGPAQKLADHAAFGRLSYEDWGALVHRHVDHHLQQFGR